MGLPETNIFSRIKNYLKLSAELQKTLSDNPDEAPKFQEVFNLTVDRVYQDIMDFEKENIEKFEMEVYRLKNIFDKRYRHHFHHGEYIIWVFNKPYGYAGDFQIVDYIYQNAVRTKGFDRLWDSWFQQLAASIAVRQRKDDFKKSIVNFIKEHPNKKLRIMNLACGPCREIKELLEGKSAGEFFKNVIFDCYDFDINAITYAKQFLGNFNNVNFFNNNAIRLALAKNIENQIPYKYDLIYSAGLFDYLGDRLAVRLIVNLSKLIKHAGAIMISNALDKYSTPSPIWMEWIGEWYLIYRTEDEFRDIFLNGGFAQHDILITPQHNRFMQYALLRR
jgi:thiol-disulfide isomerase/thioredoxin